MKEKAELLSLCDKSVSLAVFEQLSTEAREGLDMNELAAMTFFGMSALKKNADKKIDPEDQQNIITECEEQINLSVRTIDTYQGDHKFVSDYPFVCHSP